jgi:hypothetical protein
MLKKEFDKLKKEKKALIAREYQDLPIVETKSSIVNIQQAPASFDVGTLLTSAVISIIVLLLIL